MPIAGVVLALLGVIYQHANPFVMALFAVVWSAMTGGLGYAAGGPSSLRADKDVLIYQSALSKTKVLPRENITSIVRERGARGVPIISFYGRERGTSLLTIDDLYERADLQRLADYLHVALG